LNNFEKIYVLDTNVILNDVVNIEILSQQSSNLIVLPETVMDEIDVKKTGFEEINFQARSFGRLLEKADILYADKNTDYTISRMFINSDKNITIDVISLNKYKSVEGNVDRHILNDRKILEVAEECERLYDIPIVFISNDVMCRLRAISLGLKTEGMGRDYKEDLELYQEIEYKENTLPKAVEAKDLSIPDNIFGLCLYKEDGNRSYYYRSGNIFHEINEDELKRQDIKPQNIEQKIYSSMINDPFYDVVVVDAPAGSGKTLIALSAAMKLVKKNPTRFNKIVYMRKTVNADDEEMGFLPGTQEDKLSPYLAPLYSNLEAIINAKFKQNRKFTKEELENKMIDLIKEYQITSLFEGFLRGTNIRDAVVIIDEIQNESVASIRTSLTRVTEGCKIIAIGSNKQIDNKYINKHTSALTYLINRIMLENKDVNIGAIKLTKTVRSRIAEWADDFK
jgi:PhoH-like ATPase